MYISGLNIKLRQLYIRNEIIEGIFKSRALFWMK